MRESRARRYAPHGLSFSLLFVFLFEEAYDPCDEFCGEHQKPHEKLQQVRQQRRQDDGKKYERNDRHNIFQPIILIRTRMRRRGTVSDRINRRRNDGDNDLFTAVIPFHLNEVEPQIDGLLGKISVRITIRHAV